MRVKQSHHKTNGGKPVCIFCGTHSVFDGIFFGFERTVLWHQDTLQLAAKCLQRSSIRRSSHIQWHQSSRAETRRPQYRERHRVLDKNPNPNGAVYEAYMHSRRQFMISKYHLRQLSLAHIWKNKLLFGPNCTHAAPTESYVVYIVVNNLAISFRSRAKNLSSIEFGL